MSWTFGKFNQLAVLLLAIGTGLPFWSFAVAQDEMSEAVATRYCFSGSDLFSFDDIPGWNFGTIIGDVTPSSCIYGERTMGTDKVAALSARFLKSEAVLSTEILTGLGSDLAKVMQQRKGDPIGASGSEFLITKLFAPDGDNTSGYFSFASTKVFGGTVVVTLTSSTREGHDKNYQQFRDWVRTFKKAGPSSSGTAH